MSTNQGLTSTDQALGFTASDVPQPQALNADGYVEPTPSQVDSAPSSSGDPRSTRVVLDQGNRSDLLAEAERDAQKTGVPGSTRVIEPIHKSDPKETVVNDPIVPPSAKQAPWFGVPPAEGVPFKKQVEANARYYRGKFTNDDKQVEQGAAELRGDV